MMETVVLPEHLIKEEHEEEIIVVQAMKDEGLKVGVVAKIGIVPQRIP
jgi:hypothetical protein